MNRLGAQAQAPLIFLRTVGSGFKAPSEQACPGRSTTAGFAEAGWESLPGSRGDWQPGASVGDPEHRNLAIPFTGDAQGDEDGLVLPVTMDESGD